MLGYSLLASLVVASAASTSVNCDELSRHQCQSPTADPLTGCPPGTLLVAQNISLPTSIPQSQVFQSIQSAVLTLANTTTPSTILILPGTYHEQVNITTSAPLTILGQTSTPNNRTNNAVRVVNALATGNKVNKFDNAYTATLIVAPSLEASLTGSGTSGYNVSKDQAFGSTDFRVYNVDFSNEWSEYSNGPALALAVGYVNSGFYFCRWGSYQDTIYVGKVANAYFYENEIAGETDFLYGFGTAWIQSSLLTLRGCGGGITAWKGSNTSFVNTYGVYIHDSQVQKANQSLSIKGKCALGRPWNAQHRSVFANTTLDDSIRSSGYIEWSSSDTRINFNTTMAEYNDTGPGFDLAGRQAANITKLLTASEYAPYSTLAQVFQYPLTGKSGNIAWIDQDPEDANGN